jgi:hypothetical protein
VIWHYVIRRTSSITIYPPVQNMCVSQKQMSHVGSLRAPYANTSGNPYWDRSSSGPPVLAQSDGLNKKLPRHDVHECSDKSATQEHGMHRTVFGT